MYYTPYRRLSSFKGCLPSMVVFRQWASSLKGPLTSKVIFRQSLSSVQDRLSSKVVFHQRSSSIKGRLPSKFIFRERSSFIKGGLRSFSIEGHLPSKIFFNQRLSSSFGSFSLLVLVLRFECGIAQLSLSLFVSSSFLPQLPPLFFSSIWSTSMTSSAILSKRLTSKGS